MNFYKLLQEAKKKKMDAVDQDELDGSHDEREDGDIDNDGDEDSSDEYLHNRRKAVSKAIGKSKAKVQEEVEELDELSKKTLGAYVKKAAADMSSKDSLDMYKGAQKRYKGIVKATDKLAKEEAEELGEAGPKMKPDFVKTQRAKDAAHNDAMGRTATGRKKPVRTMTSTQRSMASMKKEEAEELDEALKVDTKIRMAAAKMKRQMEKEGKTPAQITKAIEVNFPSLSESVELDEVKKDHFVYQRDVDKTKEVVHRGTEQSSKDWIEKNAKLYSHKGSKFDIYKGTYPNVKPSDKIKYSHVAEEVELDEMFDKVHPTLKKELGSHGDHAIGMAGSDKGVAVSFDRPKDINALSKQMAQHGYKNVTKTNDASGKHKHTYHFGEEVELDEAKKLSKKEIMQALASKENNSQKKASVSLKKAPWDMKKEEAEELDEISSKTLTNYIAKASDSRKQTTARMADKRISGQKMADDKLRKKDRYNSPAKVAATEEVKEATWKSTGHYTEDGEEWDGDQHYDEKSGMVMTGKTHDADSQNLYHYKDLSPEARTKVKIKEEVELDENVTKLSNARLKYHATKGFPHGSHSNAEIKDEHKRRMKTEPNYNTAKPSLSEEAEIEEATIPNGKTMLTKKPKISNDDMNKVGQIQSMMAKEKEAQAKKMKEEAEDLVAQLAKHITNNPKY